MDTFNMAAHAAQGPVVMGACFMVTVPALFPRCAAAVSITNHTRSTVMNVGSGFLFGFGYGFLVAMIGLALGGGIAFVISRRLLATRMQRRLDGFKYLRLINASLESNANKWNALKLVILTRLPPLFPYPIFNYAWGLTRVPPPMYLLGSAIGVIPVTAMDTYLGSLFQSLAQVPCFAVATATHEGERRCSRAAIPRGTLLLSLA